MPTAPVIGSRISAARLAAGLTQDDVAVAIKTSQVSISRWERGEALPTILQLLRLCSLLNTTPAHVLAPMRGKGK